MRDDREWQDFQRDGYLHLPGALDAATVERYRVAHDAMRAKPRPWNQHLLLTDPDFIALIQHPAIIDRQAAVFGDQLQLLQYDLLYQGPQHDGPDRSWHRDFAFPGDHPLSINTILYLDDIPADGGATYVIPGSHRGLALPPQDDRRTAPLPGERELRPRAGDVVFINAAIWHSGGSNRSPAQRRTIYIYYGHWWLKPYQSDQARPWQCLQHASPATLRLLGHRPPSDLHIYTPTGRLRAPQES